MESLLNQFSLAQIVMFIIILASSIKGVITFLEWVQNTMTNVVHKKERPQNIELKISQIDEKYEDKVNQLSNKILELQQQLNNFSDKIELLIRSDKDDIKAWITQQYHTFIQLGYIDNYSLDCIEHRYEHYVEEKGNSFIQGLIKELRHLPKQ